MSDQIKRRDQIKERIAPGVWRDMNDDVHFNIPELLAFFELPDTEENHRQIVAFAKEAIIKAGHDNAKIIHRPDKTGKNDKAI
jgi:hypothetical protein